MHIAFETFSRAILDVANLNREQLEVKSREEDLVSSFTDSTLFIHGGGEWKAINHVRLVENVTPRQPILGNSNVWQPVGMPQDKVDLQEKVAS